MNMLWIGYEWTYVKSFVAEELQRPSDIFVLTAHNEGAWVFKIFQEIVDSKLNLKLDQNRRKLGWSANRITNQKFVA